MHLKRVLSAAVFVPLFLAYVLYLPLPFFLLPLALFSTLALSEFYSISGVRGVIKNACLFWGVAIIAVHYDQTLQYGLILAVAFMSIAALRLLTRRDPSSAIPELSAAIMGLIYIPSLLMFHIDVLRGGAELLIQLYVSVWLSDSMAYYIGKGFGKRKLYPEISPNKTIAGGVGSLAGGISGAVAIKGILLPQMDLFQALLIGFVIGLVSIIGDLVESMFKRDAGVKDSSGIIPGHGGVLDKVDSLTFAGPLFYIFCHVLGITK